MTPADLAALTPVADDRDDIADHFKSAFAAYRAGDADTALKGVAGTLAALCELRARALAAFLPPAEDDWTRMVAPDSFPFGEPVTLSATGRYGRWRETFDIAIWLDPPPSSRLARLARLNRLASFLDSDSAQPSRPHMTLGGQDFERTDRGYRARLGRDRLQVEVQGHLDAAKPTLRRMQFEGLEHLVA